MAGKLIASILLVPLFLASLAVAGTVAFKAAQSYTVGTNPTAAAVGDFDGDGKIHWKLFNTAHF